MQNRDKLFIAGKWVPANGSGTIEVVEASTEQVMGAVPEGTAADVEAAVAAARRAFAGWAATPVKERIACLDKIREGLKERSEEIARTISAEVGMPLKLAGRIQAGLPLMVLESTARIAAEFPFEERIGNSLVVKEPVGVVGCITPWNYPLNQVVAKVAPALAAGCTVVLKPSEVAPFTAFILAEVVEQAGLPAGVFNLVTGFGPAAGEALAAHPDVDMVSFTGSTGAGRRVSELAARTVKRTALELGGKSAAVILEDADLEKAVKATVSSCFLNSGQTCSSLTRMLVPESRYEEAAALAAQIAETFTPGDPAEATTRLGPLVSERQRERVRGYIRRGLEEGAQLLTGGAEAPEGLPKGYFVRPTVFGRVEPQMTIAREEIFGPVLSILSFRDEAQAVAIANDSDYGLAGAVWSGDEEAARRVARGLRTGQVDINGGRYNPLAPFGGFKQSGHGRELGRYGLEEYLEVKSLQLPE